MHISYRTYVFDLFIFDNLRCKHSWRTISVYSYAMRLIYCAKVVYDHLMFIFCATIRAVITYPDPLNDDQGQITYPDPLNDYQGRDYVP